jgi:uncharacterized SAM-binding protein YcdF (DUF218 family)
MRWRNLRRGLAVIGLMTLVAALYLTVTAVQVWQVGRHDQTMKVDAIVVLGAAQYDGRPSPQLQARLDRALDLYEQGWAPLIAVTGGSMPGDRFSEAEASRRYLVQRGVAGEAITGEDRGRSTWESLDQLSEVLLPRGVSSVLLVSDPFHLLRVRLSAAEAGFVVATTPTDSGSSGGVSSLRRYVKEAVGVAVGRVIGFERLWRLTG